MFGPDWPVSTLAASYRDVLAVAQTMISRLDQAGRAAVLAGTAVTAYGLG